MRRRRDIVLISIALAAVFILSGCLQSETTVTVRPDGSGVVEERFLMRAEFVQMIAGMAEEASGESFSLFDREKLEQSAGQMGEGVSLDSAEPLETDWGRGYIARYTFDDISEVRINQNPGDNVPDQGMSRGPDTETTEYIRFTFQPGNPAELQISMPQPDADDESPDTDGNGEMDSGQLEQVMQFYQDMRISLRLRFQESIVSTNATHREGDTITLMNIDFNTILEDSELARNLLSENTDSLAEVQNKVGDIPGVQAESQSSVTVRFR